jgi:hypothetical protein
VHKVGLQAAAKFLGYLIISSYNQMLRRENPVLGCPACAFLLLLASHTNAAIVNADA